MVSDNDCDVAVCDIKGVGIFPHQAIWDVLCIYKIYACISYPYETIFSFFLSSPILRCLFLRSYCYGITIEE